MKAIFLTILIPVSARCTAGGAAGQRTEKPVLHGREWVAITGKPLAATAGAMIFAKGGNAVDAACAMLGAVCTMHDVLSWGGETQALIYNPKTGKVIGLNALGVAPTGATAEFYKAKGYAYPPEYGVLSAVTPGTPGRAPDDARRIRDDEPRRGPGAGPPDGRRLSDGQGDGRPHREGQGQDQGLALLPRRSASPPRRGRTKRRGPGEIFRQPDLAETLKQARRGRAPGPGRGQDAEGGHLRRL